MKLYILDREEAELEVKQYKEEDTLLMDIPIDSIVNWYPLSNAYTYVLDKDGEYLELKRLVSNLPYAYNIKSNSTDLRKKEQYKCKVGEWDNPCVRKDNYKVIDKARRYGLPTLIDDFTLKEVEKGFKDLGTIFNSLKSIIINRYTELLSDEELRLYKLKDDETQLGHALKHSDDSINTTYNDLGQIFNMLLIMKKISKK